MRCRVLSALLLAPCAALSLLTAEAVAVPVYRSGHTDIGVDYFPAEDRFSLRFHFGGDVLSESLSDPRELQETYAELSTVAVRIPDPAVARPGGTQWDFMGTSAGQPLWYGPQTADPNKPFLGFATENLSIGSWIGGITFSLTEIITRPNGGEFSVWQTGFFGTPTVKFDTVDVLGGDDAVFQATGGHDHYNWGFTQPGVYTFEITATGTHSINGPASGSGLLTFYVTNAVPEPAGALLAIVGTLGLAGFRRRRLQAARKV